MLVQLQVIKYKNAVAYTRIASNMPESELSNALNSQKIIIRELANNCCMEIVEWFEQIGGKAAATPKTQLNEVFVYCRANPDVKFVVVSHPDRICRNITTYNYWKKKFKSLGVKIVTPYTDSLDEDTPIEVFMETIVLGASSYQRSTHSQAVKRGLEAKKNQDNGSNK